MFGLWLDCGLIAALTTGQGEGKNQGEGRSDAALIAAAQRGDVAAFGALHTRYYKRIYHLAYLKTNHAQEAEDVASEAFVRALAHLKNFRLGNDSVSFYPWLHRIAVNLIIDSARQRPPSGVVSLDAPLIAGVRSLLDSHLPDTGPTPQEIVERHEVQQLVRSALAALPEDQGDALIYRFLGDLSAREMAPLLGRSEAAVKSLLHRAVLALKHEITRRVDTVERLEQSRAAAPAEKMQREEMQREETQHVGRV